MKGAGEPVAPERAPCVIVTRPEQQAREWVTQLQQAGFNAESLPLLEISPLLQAAELARQRLVLTECAAVMLVSVNAAEHFLHGWQGPGPADLRWLVPGPGTAARLLALGVPAAQIDAPALDADQFDSEALWQALAGRPWAGARVLMVRGRSGEEGGATGRQWLAEQLGRAGARVDELLVYERRAPKLSESQRQRMERSCSDGSIWLFSSSQALAHLPTDLPWQNARALATHPRIARAAQALGFVRLWHSRPSLADIVASIKSLSHE